MKKNMAIKQSHFGQQLAFTLVILVLLTAPFLINSYLKLYEKEVTSFRHEENLNRGKLLLSRLEEELNRKRVLDQAIEKFKAQSTAFFKANKFSIGAIEQLDYHFKKIFHKDSIVFWYTPELTKIKLNRTQKYNNNRAWVALVKTILTPKTSNKMDKKIADSLLKSMTANFLDHKYFSKAKHENIEILFKAQRYYFSLSPIRDETNNIQAYFLSLIPLDKSKKGWLENRALTIMKKQKISAGAYDISQAMIINGSKISSNLMHGFYKKLENRQKTDFSNRSIYYYFDYSDSISDLVIAVAFKPISAQIISRAEFILGLRIITFSPLVIAFLGLIYFTFSDRHKKLSLLLRLKLATIALTWVPTTIVLIMGLMHLIQAKIENKKILFRKLDSNISRFEENIAHRQFQLSTDLKVATQDLCCPRDQLANNLNKIFKRFEPLGCDNAAVLLKEGKLIRFSNIDPKLSRTRISYMFNFYRDLLRLDNFNLKQIENIAPVSLSSSKTNPIPVSRHKFHQKFAQIEVGNLKANLFSSYLFETDISNKKTACLIMGFNKELTNRRFIFESLKLNSEIEGKVFIAEKNPAGIRFNPKLEGLKNLLRTANMTGETYKQQLKYNQKEYLILARPLKGLQTSALAVAELKTANINTEYFLLLSILISISILSSKLIFQLLTEIFINPINELIHLVKKASSGKYPNVVAQSSNDELHKLKFDFATMLQGLREKAKMAKYLSQDLISQNTLSTTSKVQKKKVIIMFAGIRNFTRIEKSLSPSDALTVMNYFLSNCETSIKSHGGEIDKFMGDTVMAVYPCTTGNPEAVQAIKASLEIKKCFDKNLTLPVKKLNIGIGLAMGEVISGQVGSRHKRLDFTNIGDTVNLAARLEKLAGRENTAIILAEEKLVNFAANNFKTQKLKLDSVKGKKKKLSIVSISGEKNNE